MSTKKTSTDIGIILLAAGGSSRLGHPKQLLTYNGRTLLQLSVDAAKACGAHPVLIVLGANTEAMAKQIDDVDVRMAENKQWEEGMASSIRCGVTVLNQISPKAEGIILMVCDQPFVSASLLKELITTYQQTGKPIVACSYENTFGPPVFFHHSFFEELLRLTGDVGARSIVRKYIADVAIVPFPEGKYDVDTEADYEKLVAEETEIAQRAKRG